MKKYFLMLLTAAIFLTAAWGIRGFAESVPEVDVLQVQRAEVSLQVTCTGRIEEEGLYEMYARIPLVASHVYVKEGDRVQKGDRIAMIDPEATFRHLETEVTDLLSMMNLNSLWPREWVTEAIPDNNWLPQYIRAAADGEISQLTLSRYSATSTEVPVASISTGGDRYVRLEVRESELGRLHTGQQVQLTGTGLKRDYTGTVQEISGHAKTDGSSGNAVVEVHIAVPEAGEDFRPGLTVSASVAVETQSQAIVVPYEAVRIDETCQEYAMVYRDGQIHKQQVTVLEDSETGYLIGEGLEEGDLILLNHGALDSGTWVRPCLAKVGEQENG